MWLLLGVIRTFGWLWLLTAGGLAAGVRQPVQVGSLLEDGLDLEADRHRVADRDATAAHRDDVADAEVAPVDLRGRGEPGPLPAPRVRDEPVDPHSQQHLPGDAAQRQLTVDDPAVAGLADAGRAVAHRRVLVDLEVVGGAEVVVTRLVAGVDGRQVDRRGNRRAQWVLVGDDRDVVAGEPAAHLGDHEVPDGEGDLGVHRVGLPGADQVARDRDGRGDEVHGFLQDVVPRLRARAVVRTPRRA